MLQAPERLLPAGSLAKMHAAFDFGADAVYAGQPRYSLRVRNNDFSTLQEGIDGAHARGKQFFVASNIFAHNAKLKTYLHDMEPVIAMKPDALIMADPVLIMMARELSLDEIEEIRQRCPEMELEVFVHGALCIAYSGRCLLSGYFNHRDPNQGTCTNSCRWDYKVQPAAEDASGDLGPTHIIPLQFRQALEDANRPWSSLHQQPRHPLADQPYLIEEAERPGQLMPILEDEHGTYIMNSKDLRAVEHIERLVKIGVTSLKVEGRTKSLYYAARTAQVYRQTTDDAVAGRPFDIGLLGQGRGQEPLRGRRPDRGDPSRRQPRHHAGAHRTGSGTGPRAAGALPVADIHA